MELHQLLYFVAVAETGGFSRAAERCHVAQPSLSQQVQKLEHELGQPLFDRLGRGVTLTEAGRALLPRARVILAEVQQIKRSLRQEIQDGYGQLAVGVIPTVAPYLLPGIIRRFSELYPKAEPSWMPNLEPLLFMHKECTDTDIRDPKQYPSDLDAIEFV